MLVVELFIFEEKDKLKKLSFLFFLTPVIAASPVNKSDKNTLWKI